MCRNQNAITHTVGATLESLRGSNWNQLENVAFFVQVAYVSSEGRLKTCTYVFIPFRVDNNANTITSVRVADIPPGVPKFIDLHPHFEDNRKAFKGWAGRVLTRTFVCVHLQYLAC